MWQEQAEEQVKIILGCFFLSCFLSREVTFTDAGVYSCHATNKFGSANANGTLIVKGGISFPFFVSSFFNNLLDWLQYNNNIFSFFFIIIASYYPQNGPLLRMDQRITRLLQAKRLLSVVMLSLIRHST